MALLETLKDQFVKGSRETAKWSQFTAGSATFTYDTTGCQVNYPASSTSSTDGDLTSQSSYNLTGSYGYVEILAVPSASTHADASFSLQDSGANNAVVWEYEAGTLYAEQIVSGTQTNLFSVSYNSTTHRFWRIRESGGTTYWDTSPDGGTWTNQYSKANPITVTALFVNIGGTCWQAETSPGTFKWRNFNGIMVVQSTTGAASGFPSSLSTNNFTNSTVSGNSIVVAIQAQSATNDITSVTDNKSNSYTKLYNKTGNSMDIEIWVAQNITGGSGHNITIGDSGSVIGGIIAYEVHGLASSGNIADVYTGSTGAHSGVLTPGTTSTTVNAYDLVIVAGSLSTTIAGTWTVGSGFEQLKYTSGTGAAYTFAAQTKVVGVVGTQTGTITNTTTNQVDTSLIIALSDTAVANLNSASLMASSIVTVAGVVNWHGASSDVAGSILTVAGGVTFNSGSIALSTTSYAYATMIQVVLGQSALVATAIITATYPTIWLGTANIVAGSIFTGDGQIASINDEKFYEYKIFDSSGVYLKSLDDVISDFTYQQNINTPGNAITVELGQTSEFNPAKVTNLITQDTSENIDTEASEDLIVVTDSGAQLGAGGTVDINYQIEVWVYYGYSDFLVDETGANVVDENGTPIAAIYGSPSGLCLFKGYISSYSARYGQNETTVITCLPYSADMAQTVIKNGENTSVAYNSYDPSSIVTGILDNFISQGGSTSYNSSSVLITSTKVSYTFKLATTLEGIKKALEFAPTDWWWDVNVGTNMVNFKPIPQYPTHTFVLDKHIKDLELTKTIENIVNTFYFLGGDVVAGDDSTMLYKKYTDSTSVTNYRRHLGRQTDQRVTDATSADIIGNSNVATNKDPRFTGTVTLLDKVYDIESIELGQLVAFSNFNNFIDSLVLQIVGINYSPDSMQITLDSVLPQPSKRLEDIKRNLVAVETQSVPDTPS